MVTSIVPTSMPIPAIAPAAEGASVGKDVVAFYEEATADYRFWSPSNLNMHFGYGTLRTLFDREAMLEAMNTRVLEGIAIVDAPSIHVADLGCGTGATMRTAAGRTRFARFTGVTLAPEHVRRAAELNATVPGQSRLRVVRGDYTATPFPDAALDGAWALESSCHGPGLDKAPLIAEAARILKPGARFVIADGFRTDKGRPFGPVSGAAYRALCRKWALSGLARLDLLKAALESHGFEDIRVEDASWRVALSVLHVPFVTAAFFAVAWRKREQLSGWRLSNAFASLLTMLMGLMRWRFSYCVVTATRSSRPTQALP